MRLIHQRWTSDNPRGFNDMLLAKKIHAPHRRHHRHAISTFFAVGSKQPERVPASEVVLASA